MAKLDTINTGIVNSYVKKPKNLLQYNAYRGVTDFTQIGQFAQFETGYSYLSVIEMPRFMEALANADTTNNGIRDLENSFKHILEYEFRGLDGLPDISSETMTITNGVQEVQLINKVTEDSAVSISMSFFEKSGMPIAKYVEYYLTGIKDKRTQAKTYHGAIAAGLCEPDPENEVFTFLYFVTDNTYLELERATLLTNCQLTGIENMSNSQKGEISNKEITLNFNCFPITGAAVDQAAKAMLQTITGVQVTSSAATASTKYHIDNSISDPMALDSSGYKYDAISKVTAATR